MDKNLAKYNAGAGIRLFFLITYALISLLTVFRLFKKFEMYYKVHTKLFLVSIILASLLRCLTMFPGFFSTATYLQDLILNLAVAISLIMGLVFQHLLMNLIRRSALFLRKNPQKFLMLGINILTYSAYCLELLLIVLIPFVYSEIQGAYGDYMAFVYSIEGITGIFVFIAFLICSYLAVKMIQGVDEACKDELKGAKLGLDKKLKLLVTIACINFVILGSIKIVFWSLEGLDDVLYFVYFFLNDLFTWYALVILLLLHKESKNTGPTIHDLIDKKNPLAQSLHEYI